MKKFIFLFFVFIFLVHSELYSQTWTQQTSPVNTDLFCVSSADANIIFASGASGKVIRTTNGGTIWTVISNGITSGQSLYTIGAINWTTTVCGSDNGTLWRTSNGGSNWNSTIPSPVTPFINIVHFFDAVTGFVVGDPENGFWRIWYTTNAGVNWTPHPNPPPATGTEAGWSNAYCAADTGHIFWCTNTNKLLKGSLRGSFLPVSIPVIATGIWFCDNNTGVITTFNGVSVTPLYRTTNGGTAWTPTSFTPPQYPYCVKGAPNVGYIWIGGGTANSGYVYRSTDYGVSFEQQSFSSVHSVNAMTFQHQELGWACTAAGEIYKYTAPIYQGINNNEEAAFFSLNQNYPNPFNPKTIINYKLAINSYVKLIVYDLMGRELQFLVNEKQNAGTYEVEWNAANYPSGVYYYRLSAGDFSETRKMVLVK